MKIKSPDGQTWRVSRRWVPWRRRTKNLDGDFLPTGPNLGDDPISLVIGLFLLVLAIPFVVVAVVVALELLLLLLLLPFAILARIFFGRHWQVEIRRGFKPYWEEASGDWGASGRRIGVISAEIARGNLPPRTVS